MYSGIRWRVLLLTFMVLAEATAVEPMMTKQAEGRLLATNAPVRCPLCEKIKVGRERADWSGEEQQARLSYIDKISVTRRDLVKI